MLHGVVAFVMPFRHADVSTTSFGIDCGNRIKRMKYWETIPDNLSKAGWSWGCVSAVTSEERIIWVADAHRDDGKRFVMHAHQKLTAFLELQSAVRVASQT